MAKSFKKILREEYNRLKKTMEKIMKTKEEGASPQLVLQPVRSKNI